MSKNYYDLLNVSSDASDEEIKKSYRKLAMRYHPDRNPNNKKSEEKFKEISEAYEILRDKQKRQHYYQFGQSDLGGQYSQGFSSNTQDFGNVFGDIFGDIFGTKKNYQRKNTGIRGSDLQYNMSISLEEAFHGVEKRVKITTLVKCKSCEGKGSKLGSRKITCTGCQGSGNIRMSQGFFSVEQTCSNCHGQGTIIKDPCSNCKSSGRMKSTKSVNINIPPGINTGDKIRLSGEGEAGTTNSASGDLYICIEIKKHSMFYRDGFNLQCDIPISFLHACLGGEVEVPIIGGKVNLKIPRETQTGKMFRLKGKGIKHLRSREIGDLMCRVVIETPINLNDNQKTLLKGFGESLNLVRNHSPRSTSWIENIKKFFRGSN